MSQENTIAAIITAPGEAGVAIVRLSGPEALGIADKIFKGPSPAPSKRPPNTFVHGFIQDGTRKLDEVLLLIMRAPASYTAEDVVEIQGHGGTVPAKSILRLVVDQGARVAEPGEFTKRAFLNGRIDLLQAEGVLDIIKAKTDRSAAAALEQLEGGLTDDFEKLYEDLIHVAADIEATLDFPEEDLPHYVMDRLIGRLASLKDQFAGMISSWDEGHILREGLVITILGRPNAGKSTLLNTLLDTNRAIVSETPGTTRDTIEEGFILEGLPVRIIDTAGLRSTDCAIEQEGIDRANNLVEKADLLLYVLDASQNLDPEEEEFLKRQESDKTILVLNKIDLGKTIYQSKYDHFSSVSTSLVQKTGLEDLKRAILRKVESRIDLSARPHAVIGERHREILVQARDELQQALDMLEERREELVALSATHLREALKHIGSATGKVYEEALLDNIFSRFCVGK